MPMKYAACFVALLLSVTAFAGKKLPLSAKVTTAKTVYIENRSGYASIGDKAFDELSKWGRFKIVSEKKDADLIVLLTSRTEEGGSTATSNTVGNTTVTNISDGSVSVTELSLIDPSTGDVLFSDSRPWGKFKSATVGIIKELRKRVEGK
jgi:hypothetical protein